MKKLFTLILLAYSIVVIAQESEVVEEKIDSTAVELSLKMIADESDIIEQVFKESIDATNTKPTFKIIEDVPVYKGANPKWSSHNLKQYMDEAVDKLIQKNFDNSVGYHFGLTGRQIIRVLFKVGKEGNVIGVKVRASHPELEKEAIRVMNLIPKFDAPGMQKGKPVVVPFTKTIVFIVEEDGRKNEIESDRKDISKLRIPDVYPVFRNCRKKITTFELEECTTRKVMNFIQMKFDGELANRLFPTQLSTNFKVEFIIDKNGGVDNITAKAHKKEIAKHVIAIVKSMPKFKEPGYTNDVPVDTPFSISMTIYFTDL